MATISENKQQISDNNATILANVDKVYEAGKQAELDAFWDEYQQKGGRKSYDTAFSGTGWTDQSFRPKYDIYPTSGYMMFRQCLITGNLVEKLNSCGVSLDTSRLASSQYMFNNCKFSRIGELDFTKVTNGYYTFYWSEALETIDKIISSAITHWEYSFVGCVNLTSLTIEGVIGTNGFNVQSATLLTHDSLMSIINALADKSTDTSGTAWKVTFGSTNLAKLTTEEIAIAKNKGWDVV